MNHRVNRLLLKPTNSVGIKWCRVPNWSKLDKVGAMLPNDTPLDTTFSKITNVPCNLHIKK